MCSYVHELSTHYVYSSAFVCGRMIFYNVMQLQFSGWRRGGDIWYQSGTNLIPIW